MTFAPGPPAAELSIELAAEMRAQRGVASSKMILKHVSEETLSRLVRSGQLVRLWRGLYALPSHSADVHSRLIAADLTIGETAVAYLHTTAALFGFDVSGDTRTHILSPAQSSSMHRDLVQHRVIVTAPLCDVAGRPASDPYETALKVAATQREPPKMLAVLDAALRSGAIKNAQVLTDQADRVSVNRIRKVRPLLQWADPRAESPAESWLRWVFLDAGLPPPIPQFPVMTRTGVVRRLDLAWPEFKVGCEYDGVAFHTGAALYDDRSRLNDLTAEGWAMVFATGAMVWTGRAQLVAKVLALLEARGFRS